MLYLTILAILKPSANLKTVCGIDIAVLSAIIRAEGVVLE